MAISDADVLHVARLARLRLDPDDVGRMREQLSTILGHVQELSKLDLGDVAPTAHALDFQTASARTGRAPPGRATTCSAGRPDPADGGFRVPPTA